MVQPMKAIAVAPKKVALYFENETKMGILTLADAVWRLLLLVLEKEKEAYPEGFPHWTLSIQQKVKTRTCAMECDALSLRANVYWAPRRHPKGQPFRVSLIKVGPSV